MVAEAYVPKGKGESIPKILVLRISYFLAAAYNSGFHGEVNSVFLAKYILRPR
jgi:hypothetical protein